MPRPTTITQFLFGTTHKMRRVMTYWAATALLYSFCGVIVYREMTAGSITRLQGGLVGGLGVLAVVAFYILLRSAPKLNIPNWKLALYQARFAIFYNLALYTVLDSLRGAILIGMPVVIMFCAFSLRPRQTGRLSASAIAGLAGTIAAMVLLQPQRHPLYEESVHFALTTFGMVSVTLITGELSRLRAQLVKAVSTIRTLATTDELTLLANRRHMHEVLAALQQRRAALPNQACVALLDVDFFKAINDKYGHAGGDTVLRSFATAAGATLRVADTLARWGGEEFLLLMPGIALDEASARVRDLLQGVHRLQVEGAPLTFSAGVAQHAQGRDVLDDVIVADERLYVAKQSGRDRVQAG
jgi:diguanylate cyclase (GGDEF)-like protein